MRLRILCLAAIGCVLAAGPAMAWTDQPMTQPATSSMSPVWAYPSKLNYCPAGLQPVVMGGVICCGRPTHVGYQSNTHPKRRAHKPHSGGYVATGKGYGEGYRE